MHHAVCPCCRKPKEAFGDYVARVGHAAIKQFQAVYVPGAQADANVAPQSSVSVNSATLQVCILCVCGGRGRADRGKVLYLNPFLLLHSCYGLVSLVSSCLCRGGVS